MIKLTYIDKNGVSKNITPVTANYTRSDNIESLGMQLSFDLLNNPLDTNYNKNRLEIGGKVVMSNNGKTVFFGVIMAQTHSHFTQLSYKCYDYAYYLNKSEAIIQFNKISVSGAIIKLCNENNIPVGSVTGIPTEISKIYNGVKISDIIKDLLKLATAELGIKYRLEVRDNKLYIEKYEDLIITATYKPAPNVNAFDVTKVIGSFNCSYSAEEMATRVMVVSSSEKNRQILATAEDSNNIKTFGLLTKVEKIEDKKSSQAAEIAKKKLADLNKVKKDFKVTLFGDDTVRSGRMLVFNQPDIDLVGAFLVKNCTHKYNGRSHVMELDLEV